MKGFGIAVALLAVPQLGWAAEPCTPPVPAPVRALAGCWQGEGSVMGKTVTITVSARPIAEDALLTLDGFSQGAEAEDRYAAHLVFGGTANNGISGFWSDSFGGAYTATGKGEVTADGFAVTYAYPDNAFVNRWTVSGDRLGWQIAAKDAKGVEKPFARYTLSKITCQPRP